MSHKNENLLEWSLKNTEQGKKVIGYWDVSENAKNNMFIYSVHSDSLKRAWFKCPCCGNLSLVFIKSAKKGTFCEKCDNKVVVKSENINFGRSKRVCMQSIKV